MAFTIQMNRRKIPTQKQCLHMAMGFVLLTANWTLRAEPSHLSTGLLVKWKDGPLSRAAAAGNARIGAAVKRNFNELGWQLVELSTPVSEVDAIRAYRALDSVLMVEPDLELCSSAARVPQHHSLLSAKEVRSDSRAAAAPSGVIPNDSRFDQQWWLKKIAAPEAWTKTTGDSNVVVAVFDSGVDDTHPDLAANMWTNPGETGVDANGKDKATNGVDDDGDGYVDDVHGVNVLDGDGDTMDIGIVDPAYHTVYHGTLCSGIIAAVGNNGLGVSGLNWSAKVMAVKTGNPSYSDADHLLRFFSTGGMLAAWDYVLMMKRRGVNIRVASHSEGLIAYSPAVREAITLAGEDGILCVVAADNNGVNHDLFSTYANVQNLWPLIYVAASDSNDQMAWFSDYGKSTVHLAAPGLDIVSTTKGGGYSSESGTSLACPMVAGTAALLLAARPSLTANELKAAILGSVDRPAALRGKTITGGRLNVAKALDYLTNTVAPAIVITSLPAGPRTRLDMPIQVTFSRPMNRQSVEEAFIVTPPTQGAFNWSNDNRSMSFVPNVLFDSLTNYTVRILGSARDAADGALDGNYNQIREGTPADDFFWTFRFPVPNDDFANAQLLSGSTGKVHGTTRYTLGEDGEPTLESAYQLYSMASVWYKWQAPEPGGWFTFELPASTAFDSFLAIYAGSDLSNLVTVAADDDYGVRQSSRVSFMASAGTNYSIAVIDKGGFLAGKWGIFDLLWYPTQPPGLTGKQFAPAAGQTGTKVTLTGTNLTGATSILFNGASASFSNALTNNLDLQITAIVPPDATSGLVTVVTPHGSVTSGAKFQVLPPRLSVARTEVGDVQIRWPATSDAFVLEASDDLTSGHWAPVTAIAVRGKDESTATLLAPSGRRFYRLATR